MNNKELKNYIQSLALHFGEVVKCQLLDMDGEKYIPTKMIIDAHFISEFEKGNIWNIQLTNNGVDLIAIERERQIKEEGWDLQYDDIVNSDEQLAKAAALYALPEIRRPYPHEFEDHWPWDIKWWKPTPDDRIKELTKAGALIAAEIDRLQRLNKERN